MRYIKLSLGIFILLGSAFGHVHAASFNCANASTNIEYLICGSDKLSELDSNYGSLYRRALKAFPHQKSTIANDAFVALQKRDWNCSDEACLKSWYLDRIASVEELFTTPMPDLTERQSVGIFQLDYLAKTATDVEKRKTSQGYSTSTYRTQLPIYDTINGSSIGTMTMALTLYEIVDGSEGVVKLLNREGDEIAPTNVSVQYRYESILIVYDARGDWFNVSASSIKPVWINKNDMDPTFFQGYTAREQSVLDATEITFKSTHNLRSNPSTQSSVLVVLGENKFERVEPLELEGDWMKLLYKVPAPDSKVWAEGLREVGADKFIEHTGWIKWRRKPQDEYDHIRFEHN